MGFSVRAWAYGIAAAVLFGLGSWAFVTVTHWKSEAAKVPVLKQEIADHEATIKQIRKDAAIVRSASDVFQAELARLRNSIPAGPSPVVRVCRQPVAPPVPVPGAKPGPDEGTSGGGVLPETPGPDIGADLYGDADLADELSAQIRGLLVLVKGLSAKEPSE
jgi:hypothetical protein